MVPPRQEFASTDVQSWEGLIKTINDLMKVGRWLYRGQAHDWPLQPTLERQIKSWALKIGHAPELEKALAREFRRRLRGEEQPFIQDDMLTCLALMRHHGAPTRLLDCSYSPFVAAQTALREGLSRRPVIWCFDADWLNSHYERAIGSAAFDLAPDGKRRTRFDTVSEQQPQLVAHDNPYFLSERLTAHQGIFLFAGDIRRPFRENLKSMKGWHLRRNVLKLHLRFNNIKKVEAIKTLKRMNVSSTVLFPGLDGFARSLGEELPFYDEIYGEIERRARRKEMNNTPSARETLDPYR